ncbi:hypothetical protein ACFO6R_07620 [Eubacterium multiforme]|uniref:Flagellar hook-length control protein FliK n=1 Tax=Eubacterium multiforme TaxID=83339 RepID=A0ABT9UUA9_9FIRM|nr:hypothetical protein [Eubacterium multiforme]MDQ0149908.1 flagellar hook-length control protein FliK [Eubacterium multiforme]
MKIDMLEMKVNYKNSDIVKDSKSKDEFISILDEKALDSINIQDINILHKGKPDEDEKIDDKLNEILSLLLNKLNIINGNILQEEESKGITEDVKEDPKKVIDTINTIKSSLNNDIKANESNKDLKNIFNVKNISTYKLDKIEKIFELIENRDIKKISELINIDNTNIEDFKEISKNKQSDISLNNLKDYILNIFNEAKADTKLLKDNKDLMVSRNIVKVSKDDMDILNYIALDKNKFNKYNNLNLNTEETTKENNVTPLNQNGHLEEDREIINNKTFNNVNVTNNDLNNLDYKKEDLKSKIDNGLEIKPNNNLDKNGITSNITSIENNNLNNISNDNRTIVVRREFIKNDVVQGINYLKNHKLEKINVIMNPKELGTMKISVIKTLDKSNYLINVTNKDTLLMIKDNLNEIKNHLINMNLDSRDVNVEVKLGNFENSFNEDNNRQFNENNREEKREKTFIKENDSELENTFVEDTNINLLI